MVNIKTKLQQISDVAWIVQQGNERVGLLNKDVQDHYTFISGKTIELFNNDAEVREHFGNIKLFEDKIDAPTSVKDGFYIKGFLVDYDNPIPVEEDDPNYSKDLPLYYKAENSKVLYAAGWYAINFEKGWKHGYGPKFSTLHHYGFEGPFKNEIECRQRLKVLNRTKRQS